MVVSNYLYNAKKYWNINRTIIFRFCWRIWREGRVESLKEKKNMKEIDELKTPSLQLAQMATLNHWRLIE
jgi:hypothetical protein